MKTGAIVIDKWKLSTFERVLTAAGFPFTNAGEVAGNSILKVTVEDADIHRLADTINKANRECAS